MNKNIKIWVNYVAGALISALLLWSIYAQVTKQLTHIDASTWHQTGPMAWLVLSVSLMFVNTSLEGIKWYLLTNFVERQSYSSAFSSYLAGVAFSIITPNRIGEYPGRILYLGRSNTFRYINVSVLGVMSQLSAVYLFGFAGLVYFNVAFPSLMAKLALCLCVVLNIFIGIVYWKFEGWVPLLERFRLLRRFAVYGRLLNRVTWHRQITILLISMLRFAIFTAQYLFLLRWMDVNVPLAEGYLMAGLFYWVMAVIPSIALTELGVRGSVGIYLFQHFSSNAMGIVAATMGVWLLNLIVPSIIGSILILRMRLLR